MTPLLEATELSKAYGEGTGRVQALVDVSAVVEPGALTVVTGPSGSGKTTLLHCLSGLAVPDGGQVSFGGQHLFELSDADRAELRRRRMGFVFQRDNLLPALNVTENVALPLVMRGEPRDVVTDRVQHALDQVGLQDRPRAYPAQLSGGEQQRAAVARAVCSSPDVLWADEPTGALDSVAARELLTLLQSLVRDGCAVVVVSHAADVAGEADAVIALSDGRRVR